MNRRPSGFSISKTIEGFIQFKAAEGLSPRSLYSYERLLNQWLAYMGDVELAKITSQEIRKYLAWLRTDYTLRRWNGKNTPSRIRPSEISG